MKFEIKNFGPIDHITIDLDKDLHMFFGKNSVGKSYAATVLYCFLKIATELQTSFLDKKVVSSNLDLTHLIEDQLAGKESDSAVIFRNLITKPYANYIAERLRTSLGNSFLNFDDLRNRFSDKKFEITVHFSENCGLKITCISNDQLEVSFEKYLQEVHVFKNTEVETMYCLEVDKQIVLKIYDLDQFHREVSDWINNQIVNLMNGFGKQVSNVYFFPSGRESLHRALGSIGPLIAELANIRNRSEERRVGKEC